MAVDNWLSRLSSRFTQKPQAVEDQYDPTLPSPNWYERLKNFDTEVIPMQGPQPESPMVNKFVSPEITPEDDIVARVQKIQQQTAANKAADEADLMQRSMERRAKIAQNIPTNSNYSDGMNWNNDKLTQYGFSPEEIDNLTNNNHADSTIDYFVSQGWLDKPASIIQNEVPVSQGNKYSYLADVAPQQAEQLTSAIPYQSTAEDRIPAGESQSIPVNDSGRVVGGQIFGNPLYVKPENAPRPLSEAEQRRKNKFEERWNKWKGIS